MTFIHQKQKKSALLGNGINIQFGGKAYSNRFIISRIVFNARCDKYDSLFEGTLTGEEIEKLFRRLPLEDWFLLLRLFFLDNQNLTNMWKASKAGLEWIILDAIYNDGRIQDVHCKMKKSVKRFFKSFDSIFTLNYDNNIEFLTNKLVYHLHGDYSVLTDSENPETVQGS